MASKDALCVCVDVMGGDHAPDVVIEGCAQALDADPLLALLLTGPAEVIEPFAARFPGRVETIATTEVIAMGEHPVHAVRKKKDSSIVVGCHAVADGRAQAFFSAGSTGACMSAATLIIGRLKGVIRPALATVVPSPVKPIVLLDVGANADCKPEYLVQFAEMGRVYSQRIVGTENPTIALLNIGEEEEKGSMAAQEAHRALAAHVEGFSGNAEGNDILQATYDVIVTDGFTGNVALKTIEGTAKALFSALKRSMMSSTKNKLAAAALKPAFRELKGSLSSDTYGGAPLLGLKKVVIIGHGSSNAAAIENGISATAAAARGDLPALIAGAIREPAASEGGSDARDQA